MPRFLRNLTRFQKNEEFVSKESPLDGSPFEGEKTWELRVTRVNSVDEILDALAVVAFYQQRTFPGSVLLTTRRAKSKRLAVLLVIARLNGHRQPFEVGERDLIRKPNV